MKSRMITRLVSAAGLAMALAVPQMTMAAPQASDELIAIEGRWASAMVGKDWAALETIVAPDWTGQNPGGKLTDRATLMAEFRSGRNLITAMKNHDLHVRVVGDIGIVQGMDDETSSFDGKDTSGSWSWTDIYQRRAGKWVAIASQVTPVSK